MSKRLLLSLSLAVVLAPFAFEGVYRAALSVLYWRAEAFELYAVGASTTAGEPYGERLAFPTVAAAMFDGSISGRGILVQNLASQISDHAERRQFLRQFADEAHVQVGSQYASAPSTRVEHPPSSPRQQQRAGMPSQPSLPSNPSRLNPSRWQGEPSRLSLPTPAGNPSGPATPSQLNYPSRLKPSSHPSQLNNPSRLNTSGPPNVDNTQAVPANFGMDVLARAEQAIEPHVGVVTRAVVRRAALKARDELELYLMIADQIADIPTRKQFVLRAIQTFRQ